MGFFLPKLRRSAGSTEGLASGKCWSCARRWDDWPASFLRGFQEAGSGRAGGSRRKGSGSTPASCPWLVFRALPLQLSVLHVARWPGAANREGPYLSAPASLRPSHTLLRGVCFYVLRFITLTKQLTIFGDKRQGQLGQRGISWDLRVSKSCV